MKLPRVDLSTLWRRYAARPMMGPIIVSLVVMMMLGFGVGRATAATGGPDDGSDPTVLQEKLMSGFATFELNSSSSSDVQNQQKPTNYFPRGSDDCAVNLSSNIKVNQNCENVSDPDLQGRGQANNETAIAIDTNNTNHIIASDNDYRRGDGTCGTEYSLDKARTWNDSTVPNGFTRGITNPTTGAPFGRPREYWQSGGDTSVAWDTKGNAYLSCQVFNRGAGTSRNPDLSSALLVFRSTQNDGASWNFPGRYAAVQSNFSGHTVPLLDKPYMTVDNHVGSPFQDRIYVSWTLFAADGTANIYESHSSDYGETFSAPALVSGSSGLCPNSVGTSGNCDANQDSDPFTGPDGNLYVTFDNFNNAVSATPTCSPASEPCDNHNQILMAKSTDGGNTFSPPVKVSDYYDLPDCAPYQGGQDFGRACVPEKGSSQRSVFRATNYSSGAVNPTNPSQIAVTFGSYINKDSKESNGCVPAGFDPADGDNLFTGVKTPGACNNDILISVSNDSGATFTGTTTDPRALTVVTTDSGQATTDQWWQWEAFTKDGKLAVSYYDRQYGDDETSGNSDVSLSGSGDLTNFVVNRATSSSMPVPTEFPDAQGNSLFFGDYSGLAAETNAYPVWMDTRDPEIFACPVTPGTPPALCGATEPNGAVANDQDIFTASMSVPSK